MAKIRIYELARDLNMTNKDLLKVIREMEIEVNSHMSSLEDEMVSRIKAQLHGKNAPGLEETRVRPTVIRRRRVVKEPLPVETDEAGSAVESAPETAETPDEQQAVPAEPAVVEEGSTAVRTAKKTAKAEVTAEAAVEPVQGTVEAKAGKTTPVDLPADAPEVDALKTVDTVRTEEQAAEDKPKKVTKKKAAATKAKKAKGESPAKIIKMAEPDQIKEIVEKRQAKAEPADTRPAPRKPRPKRVPPGAVKPADIPIADATEAKGKRKKGKKKVEEETQDKRFFKKKITFRRKEVVEGVALYSGKKRSKKGRKGAKAKAAMGGQKTQITTAKAIKRRVKIDDTIMLSELAKRMGIKANEMIGKLMGMGVMATVNQTIDFDTATLVAAEFEYEVERASFEEDTFIKIVADEPGKLKIRPPVVTIMGHVDHGKTSLLDVIRKTRVTDFEAGGITQHIGAYHVETSKGRIVFLDTPGHEAFSAMRSRGAKVTDLVILVVAADDGVMPQTVEAINHAKASEVPIIVAINKIDKAGADPERVQRELSEVGLVPEDWGGDAIFVKVSAKMNEGIDDLLDMILLQSEMLELKANPDKLAVGHVVEAKLDSGRGPVATVLIQEGTLKTGDHVVCGLHYGKVRALLDDRGQQVESATPSIPVEIVGLAGVPMAGDEMVSLNNEKDAKQVSLHRTQKQRAKELAKTSRLSLDNLFERMQEGEIKDLNLIIRADVEGSIEALKDSLIKLSNEEVNINVVQAATGTITETDINLATVSDAIIIGFNVRPNSKVTELANEEHVDIRYHNIIYNVIKEIKDAIVGMMESTYEENVLGRAEVRQTFHVPKIGTIAGCYVTDGKIERGQLLRLLRDGIVTYEGKASSLRRFKDDVKEVQSGYECGIGIENYNDIKLGDVIECYYLEEIKPQIN
ncbi:MAG: translation initiation factor IF-2 [Desulfobacteraceae bacterium]|nr:translation initiation factor IF-2 [Desulfobacteraceae bacterium]